MTKADLINAIAEKSELSKKDSEKALNAAVASITEALTNGDKVQIVGFGTFEVRDKKEKEAKKRQTVVEVKEIQLSCRIDTHDFETKVKHAHRFIGDGNKVRVVVKFKGREMSHLEIGRDILAKFEEACSDVGTVDKRPALEGRFMSMVISPAKQPAK